MTQLSARCSTRSLVVVHRDSLHEREQRGRRVHRCTGLVAVDEEQQTVRVAAILRKYGVVPTRQPASRFGVHCVDAAKKLPLIWRDLDRFAVLTIDRTTHRREIDGAAGEFGADRDLSRSGASADDEQEMFARHDYLVFVGLKVAVRDDAAYASALTPSLSKPSLDAPSVLGLSSTQLVRRFALDKEEVLVPTASS